MLESVVKVGSREDYQAERSSIVHREVADGVWG